MVLRRLRRPYSGCYRQRPPRSLQIHPAREPDYLRRAIAGPQRRCCPRPCEQPALLVFLNTIQVTRTPHVFFFAPCSPDGRIAMALLSATRSTSPPPISEADLRAGRGGVAQLVVSRHGCPFGCCLRFSFAWRLPLRFRTVWFRSTSTSSHFRIEITTGPRSLPTKKHTKKAPYTFKKAPWYTYKKKKTAVSAPL